MAKLVDLKRGQALFIDHFGPHPAIVIDTGTQVIVLCGTGTQKPYTPQVCVTPGSAAAKALGLSKPTYFYASGVTVVSDDKKIVSVRGNCPWEVFEQLEGVYKAACRQGRVATQAPASAPSRSSGTQPIAVPTSTTDGEVLPSVPKVPQLTESDVTPKETTVPEPSATTKRTT
jgi:hypothetical protein